jgi:carbamoyltransferase
MRVLGINALFHDPAAALVIDGRTVAAAEEERFSRRKHGKRPVPFAAWELPERAAAWCLGQAGLRPEDLDAVTYSYDPSLARQAREMGLHDPWDHLRQTYAWEAPRFLASALPGLDPGIVRFVPHHMAHAASAAFAAPAVQHQHRGALGVRRGAAGRSSSRWPGRSCRSRWAWCTRS